MDLVESIKELEEQIKAKKEESRKMQDSFIKNISHEVRTPLNIILGFSDLMLEHEDALKNNENYLSQITLGCRKLVKLIEQNELSLISGEVQENEN
jgi:signal transduction histidine kinase